MLFICLRTRRPQILQAVPNAIGALCLNEVGIAQLRSRPSVIPSLFTVFTSDRHLKLLLDKENSVLIGTTIDELVRHHPFLKRPVFDALKATMSKIETLGNSYVVPDELQSWYKIVPVPTSAPDSDVSMEDVASTSVPGPATTPTPTVSGEGEGSTGEEASPKSHDNHIVSFMDALLRVSCFHRPTS